MGVNPRRVQTIEDYSHYYRKRRTKRSLWRKTIWPLIKLMVFSAVIIAIWVIIANKVTRPFKLYNAEYQETQKLALQLDELRKENAMLERRIKYLQSSRGAAQEARKLGWVKPGEIALILPSEDQVKSN